MESDPIGEWPLGLSLHALSCVCRAVVRETARSMEFSHWTKICVSGPSSHGYAAPWDALSHKTWPEGYSGVDRGSLPDVILVCNVNYDCRSARFGHQLNICMYVEERGVSMGHSAESMMQRP